MTTQLYEPIILQSMPEGSQLRFAVTQLQTGWSGEVFKVVVVREEFTPVESEDRRVIYVTARTVEVKPREMGFLPEQWMWTEPMRGNGPRLVSLRPSTVARFLCGLEPTSAQRHRAIHELRKAIKVEINKLPVA